MPNCTYISLKKWWRKLCQNKDIGVLPFDKQNHRPWKWGKEINQALISSMNLAYFESTFHSLTGKVTFIMQQKKKKKGSWAFTVHAMAAVCATKPTQYIDSNVNSKVLVSVCQGHQPNIEKSREINCFKNLIKMRDHMLKNSRCNYAKFIRIWEENHVFLGTIHWMLISAFL